MTDTLEKNVINDSEQAAAISGQQVWENVWKHIPSDDKDDQLLHREKTGKRWQLIEKYILSTFGTIQGLKTIELGSGRGDLSVLLAKQGAHVTLLDCNESALQAARERFDRLGLHANFVSDDMFSNLKDKFGEFDVSLSSGVVEHFVKDQRTAAIRAHADVLHENGLSIISVPHAMCPTYRLWKFYLEIRGWWPYGYENPYSKMELSRRATDAGFSFYKTHSTHFIDSLEYHFFKGLLKKEKTF